MRLGQDRLVVTPARIVAPVNSEVVLLAGVYSPQGVLSARQPVEWMLSQESVGTFVDVDDDGRSKRYLLAHDNSSRFSTNFARTETSATTRVLTRGTPSPSDDVWLQGGQTWISITSPSEGISHVTSVAPGAPNWERRRQTSTVHWVDAQWVLPSPAVVLASQSQMLTTTISRSSTGAAVADWIVRYEVAEGVPAAFSQDGVTVIEQRSDAGGRATVQLYPQSSQSGSTRVHITILSPTAGQEGSPISVGEGWTTVTWSAPGLSVQATGPHTAALDATVSYRIEVTNTGDLPTGNVTVTAKVPRSLIFLNANPAAERFGSRVRWPLESLAAGEVSTMELNCRAAREGDVRLRVEAIADGLSHESSVATRVVAPALDVRIVDGPKTATVGQRIHFNVEVANVGSGRLLNVAVHDEFDDGLEHTYGEPSPIERSIGDLEEGQVSQFGVSFIARRPGRLCHTLQATADGGHAASVRACVDTAQPSLSLSVSKSGPARAVVGEMVEYRLQITNTGDGRLTNLEIYDLPSEALDPKRVSRGYTSTPSGLRWVIDELSPGAIESRRVQCECIRAVPRAENRVTVTTAEGLRESDTVITEIAPSPAPVRPPSTSTEPPGTRLGPVTGKLRMVVDHPTGSVLVGEETTFTISLVNNRSASDRNVVIAFALPPGLRFLRFNSVSADLAISLRDDGTFEVEPIREMRAGGRRVLRLIVEAIQTGDQTVRVQVTSLRHSSPIEDLELVRVNPN
jgi:uncharacterized repeat protein (TIGR01451 family)